MSIEAWAGFGGRSDHRDVFRAGVSVAGGPSVVVGGEVGRAILMQVPALMQRPDGCGY